MYAWLPADPFAAHHHHAPPQNPPPAHRSNTWACQPSECLRVPGALSTRGLGLLPSSYSSTSSCDWKLVIGQAYGPGMPVVGAGDAASLAVALEDALSAQWDLPNATEGMARLQHKPGTSNFAVAIRLKDVSHPAANGLLHQLRTARHLHVTLSSGVVCVPAVDHGASGGLRAVRLLVLGLDPLAHREGITMALLRCAGYTVSDLPGPGCVHVASEQAGCPRLGGVADITTVVSYVVPPPDDPYLHRLPVSFVDYADNITHVLVHGDPLAPLPGLRNPGTHARQPPAPVYQPAPPPPSPPPAPPPPPSPPAM